MKLNQSFVEKVCATKDQFPKLKTTVFPVRSHQKARQPWITCSVRPRKTHFTHTHTHTELPAMCRLLKTQACVHLSVRPLQRLASQPLCDANLLNGKVTRSPVCTLCVVAACRVLARCEGFGGGSIITRALKGKQHKS